MDVATFERPLSRREMTQVMTAIMTGACPEDEVRAFLTTLARRGETAEELAAAVEVLRAHALRLPLARTEGLCDTCGTGGDGRGTFNVSTAAALIAAGAGVRVVKHGNRAASSRCGSADVLEALGVNLEATPEQVARCVEEAGFGFCFAPRFHPAMRAVAPIRKALGIRTIFNLIGPLANPAPLAFQLVGVSDPRLLRPVAEALIRLGIRNGLVVRGRDGLDEVTTTDDTDALEVLDGRLAERTLNPEALGLARSRLEELRGGEPQDNARLVSALLRGEPSARLDIALANAGCAIYVAQGAPTPAAGVAAAREAVASGRARGVLSRLAELTRDAG